MSTSWGGGSSPAICKSLQFAKNARGVLAVCALPWTGGFDQRSLSGNLRLRHRSFAEILPGDLFRERQSHK